MPLLTSSLCVPFPNTLNQCAPMTTQACVAMIPRSNIVITGYQGNVPKGSSPSEESLSITLRPQFELDLIGNIIFGKGSLGVKRVLGITGGAVLSKDDGFNAYPAIYRLAIYMQLGAHSRPRSLA